MWEEVWRRTQEWLPPFSCQIARRFGLHEADIPDAQQQAAIAVREALLRLCGPREAGRKTSGLLTLLHLVAKSRIRDYAQKTRTAEKRYDRTQAAATALEGSGDPRRPVREATPLKQLIREEDRERVRKALAQLSAEARQVVQGWLGDETFAQMAQEMGRSLPAVWRMWQDIKEQLRSQLADLADWDAE